MAGLIIFRFHILIIQCLCFFALSLEIGVTPDFLNLQRVLFSIFFLSSSSAWASFGTSSLELVDDIVDDQLLRRKIYNKQRCRSVWVIQNEAYFVELGDHQSEVSLGNIVARHWHPTLT